MKYILALFVLLFPLTAFAAKPAASVPDTAWGKIAWAISNSGEIPAQMIIGFAVLAILIVLTVFKIKGDKGNE